GAQPSTQPVALQPVFAEKPYGQRERLEANGSRLAVYRYNSAQAAGVRSSVPRSPLEVAQTPVSSLTPANNQTLSGSGTLPHGSSSSHVKLPPKPAASTVAF